MVVVKNKLLVRCLRPGSDVSVDWVFRRMKDARDLEEETQRRRCCNSQSCLGRTQLCHSMGRQIAAQRSIVLGSGCLGDFSAVNSVTICVRFFTCGAKKKKNSLSWPIIKRDLYRGSARAVYFDHNTILFMELMSPFYNYALSYESRELFAMNQNILLQAEMKMAKSRQLGCLKQDGFHNTVHVTSGQKLCNYCLR